jgi:hypothetical protein
VAVASRVEGQSSGACGHCSKWEGEGGSELRPCFLKEPLAPGVEEDTLWGQGPSRENYRRGMETASRTRSQTLE